MLTNVRRIARTARGKKIIVSAIELDVSEERVRELEHLLALERARREAIEAGMERLSARIDELARENAELRRQLGDAAFPQGV